MRDFEEHGDDEPADDDLQGTPEAAGDAEFAGPSADGAEDDATEPIEAEPADVNEHSAGDELVDFATTVPDDAGSLGPITEMPRVAQEFVNDVASGEAANGPLDGDSAAPVGDVGQSAAGTQAAFARWWKENIADRIVALQNESQEAGTSTPSPDAPSALPGPAFLSRESPPPTFELLPYTPGQAPTRVELLGDSTGTARLVDGEAAGDDLSPANKGLLAPTSDGGPPLARPIVIMRLADNQRQRIQDESLAAVAERNAMLMEDIADERVRYAFWVRDTEDRAIYGDY